MNLRSLDLNLLPVLEAIYTERSLTRASESLHLTQPAVSNACRGCGCTLKTRCSCARDAA
jgi:hypothetical protein